MSWHDETPSEQPQTGPDVAAVHRLGPYIVPASPSTSDIVEIVDAEAECVRTAKRVPLSRLFDFLKPYAQLASHANANAPREIVRVDDEAFVVFESASTTSNLHAFLRERKQLGERQAVPLFRQIVAVVAHCHDNGVVVRDIKLQRFAFVDRDRSILKLMSLDDAVALEWPFDDDRLSDKHGCPAYASPEIVHPSQEPYSGRAADVWSLGVVLYTMLVGKYPFYDTNPTTMFGLIREGQFELPHHLSHMAKSLISNMLRREPSHRLSARALLDHPWFYKQDGSSSIAVRGKAAVDQTVPENYADTPSMF